MRGCLIARHEDENVSLRFKVGEVDLYNALVTVIEPAPADAFAFPRKAVAEMFLYDPQAGPFQRVKVGGQIIHERQGEYYLMEGSNGLRFSLKTEASLAGRAIWWKLRAFSNWVALRPFCAKP